MSAFIEVRNWERFQHRDATKRGNDPKWIKAWTRLLSDDAYLSLSGHRRAILHGLWLEYARSGRRLPADTAALGRRLSLRVTAGDLAAIREAGFIDFAGDGRSRDGYRAHVRRAVDASVGNAVEGCGETRSRRGHDAVTTRSRSVHDDDGSVQPCGIAAISSRLEKRREEEPLLVAVPSYPRRYDYETETLRTEEAVA